MDNNDFTSDWVLPAGITLAQAQANPGAEFAFPQTLTTTDAAPCGSVIQRDVYSADPSAVTADGLLSWVDGRPEDSAIYVSHIFFETAPCPVIPECGPGEEAQPTETGYVCGPADLPNPIPPTVTEIPVPPTPHLAETGVLTGEGVMWALALVVMGAVAFTIRQIRRGK